MRHSPLSVAQILSWADAFYAREKRWPQAKSAHRMNSIAGDPNWASLDHLLRLGGRGLPGGSSLAQLLAQHRGVRNRKRLPRLSVRQIVLWADLYEERTGSWPTARSGAIEDAPGETWCAVDMALAHGQRGMPGGSSLALLLAERRHRRHRDNVPPLTLAQILAWADAHRARTRQWPRSTSGSIPEAPGETWHSVNNALRHSRRGLPGGFSLAQLLADQRGVPNRLDLPRLSVRQVLLWADAHHRRTGHWPRNRSGPILCSGGETWARIDNALIQGNRGLQGGTSLSRLLAKHRNVAQGSGVPELTINQILGWADDHHARTGQWPHRRSGAIPEAPRETWRKIHAALRDGGRGLAGGSTLQALLAQHRGIANNIESGMIAGGAVSRLPLTAEEPALSSG